MLDVNVEYDPKFLFSASYCELVTESHCLSEIKINKKNGKADLLFELEDFYMLYSMSLQWNLFIFKCFLLVANTGFLEK